MILTSGDHTFFDPNGSPLPLRAYVEARYAVFDSGLNVARQNTGQCYRSPKDAQMVIFSGAMALIRSRVKEIPWYRPLKRAARGGPAMELLCRMSDKALKPEFRHEAFVYAEEQAKLLEERAKRAE